MIAFPDAANSAASVAARSDDLELLGDSSRQLAHLAASPDDLERLGDEIAALAAHLHAATYRLLVRLREFDERHGWSNGFASCAHWLSWRTGIAPGVAREKVRVARALADLPRLSAAMEHGELSFSKVRALTRIATPDTEEELLELARHATAAQVERVVRAWRRVDRLAEAEADRERHKSRFLRVHADDDGSWIIRGRLDPEVGALLERALEAAAKSLYDEARSAEADAEDTATAEQRRADALGLLLDLAVGNAAMVPGNRSDEQAVASSSASTAGACTTLSDAANDATAPAAERRSPGAVRSLGRAGRVQVVLHVDAAALPDQSDAGHSVLAGGTRVSAETSRRLACDASVVVMTHDRHGATVDVGRRTRTVPTAIRRALEHRDRGCRFPGCGNRFADAHHVRHWADGGSTRLDNLVLLCRRHHRLVHEEGWHVSRNRTGEFVFSRPDGRGLPSAPAIPHLSCECGTGADVVQSAELPPPASERLDLAWTIRMMYRGFEPEARMTA